MAETEDIETAVAEFSRAFDELATGTPTDDCALLQPYYTKFTEQLSRNLDIEKRAVDYIPTNRAACRLQHFYLNHLS